LGQAGKITDDGPLRHPVFEALVPLRWRPGATASLDHLVGAGEQHLTPHCNTPPHTLHLSWSGRRRRNRLNSDGYGMEPP
jgi:hypothetical protein